MPGTQYPADSAYTILRNPHIARNEEIQLKPYTEHYRMREHYFGNLTDVLMVDNRVLAAERLGGADYDGDMRGTRYIGRPDAKIRRVAIVAHLYPGTFGEVRDEGGIYSDYSTQIIRLMEEECVQAIIPCEIIEWDLLSYISDAVMLGKDVACLNIGHFNFEELGSKYAADWIDKLCSHTIPVHYVHTGELWNYQSRVEVVRLRLQPSQNRTCPIKAYGSSNIIR